MEQYRVRITDEALNDMENIYSYISQKLLSPETAIRQYNRIADSAMSLSIFPERYRIMDSEPWHSLGMRRINVDSYSVFYVIRNHLVYITDVLYGASDIESRLKGSDL